MHPDDQHVLIVEVVEDTDRSAVRQSFQASPEIVVVEFLRGRGLEGSADGDLKEKISQSCGFIPDMTCLIVPSLPAASIAWRIIRIRPIFDRMASDR